MAAQEAHSCDHLVELQTPAVELDLMRPARAAGRHGTERGLTWGMNREKAGTALLGAGLSGGPDTGQEDADGVPGEKNRAAISGISDSPFKKHLRGLERPVRLGVGSNKPAIPIMRVERRA
jgi:hypothetical protein